MHRKVVPEIESLAPEIIKIRRHFHMHPELSHEEHETSAHIASLLSKWGIDHQTGVAGTGVVGLIEGQAGEGPTVAIRADMDALPIQEERQHGHRSRNEGVMHACGHDAHCAMVLGAANVLHGRRADLRGRIKLLFQPSEESEPSGADMMVKEGVLENPGVDSVLGIHIFPMMQTGQIGVKPGVASANADEFEILVHGRAGHAGYPHTAVDPVVAAANVVMSLQTIASRRVRPNDPVVVTVGAIQGGQRTNIIPPTVRLLGTFRTLNPQVREQVAEEIDRIAQGVANAHGATAEVKILWGCPSVTNDPALSDLLMDAASRCLGEGNVHVLPEALMGADDFAFYQQHVPGVYFRLGTGNAQKGTEFPLHHPRFDLDEDALPMGAAVLVEAAQQICTQGTPRAA